MTKASTRFLNAARESAESLRAALYHDSGAPFRTATGLMLSGVAAILLVNGGVLAGRGVALTFTVALLITIGLFVLLSTIRGSHRASWGPLATIVLGFGLGSLVYQYRHWWKWLWAQLRRINETHEVVLLVLFLIGLWLGVFVVRNWGKEQKAFIESISGILSGTVVAGLLAKLFDDQPQMTQKAFAYYALGFAMSGVFNLIFSQWLIARYTNRKSIVSRAVLDFMYGSERAETIDKYFLKNFEEDPDYAKRWLTNSLWEFRRFALQEFAERVDAKRRLRQKERPKWHYYELLAIERDKDKNTQEQGEPAQSREHKYKIRYRALEEKSRDSDSGSSASPRTIRPEMFRIGISIKNADLLEYVIAPGEYHAAFPRLGSVMGLALEMRQTIVMDRDEDRKFRNKNHKDGISPAEVEQPRGLDEIDFLSYVSIPVVSRLGEATENPLGVLNIDTKIFVSREELKGQPEQTGDDILLIKQTRTQLTTMASHLYDDDDAAIKYLEDVRDIIRPILELYIKCRVGAT